MTLCACRLVWCSVGGFLKTFPPPVRALDESRALRRSMHTTANRISPVIAHVNMYTDRRACVYTERSMNHAFSSPIRNRLVREV